MLKRDLVISETQPMSLCQEVAMLLALSALRHAGAASVLRPYNDAAESAARQLLAEIDSP